jgi:hypothetical protein
LHISKFIAEGRKEKHHEQDYAGHESDNNAGQESKSHEAVFLLFFSPIFDFPKVTIFTGSIKIFTLKI